MNLYDRGPGLRPLLAGALMLAAPLARAADGPAVFGIPVDFILFAATLIGVALFHHHVRKVALAGMAVIAAYKSVFTGFKAGPGLAGFGLHLAHEWVLIVNLLCLLVGFALLARHFEDSGVPEVLPEALTESHGAITRALSAVPSMTNAESSATCMYSFCAAWMPAVAYSLPRTSQGPAPMADCIPADSATVH